MTTAPPGIKVCGLIARLGQRMDSHVRGVAESLGITASQATALRELAEPMTLTDLAKRMGCEASNAGYVIDRMEKQNLVARRPHATDRRAKLLVLTEGGQRCRRNVLDALGRDAPIDTLSAEEQGALAVLLRKATA